MALALNKPKLDKLASDIWKSAERLRGKFKSYEYQSVILPIIVIRRLECVLIDWRAKKSTEVLKNRPKLSEKELAKLVKELELNPKQCPFSNQTDWTLRSVYEEDHTLLDENFRAYVNGFSKNVDDIIEHFNYRATIGLMVKNNRLAPILADSASDAANAMKDSATAAIEEAKDAAATAVEKTTDAATTAEHTTDAAAAAASTAVEATTDAASADTATQAVSGAAGDAMAPTSPVPGKP